MARVTFIDKNISMAKTHLIYGNILDEFCSPDLKLRDFDEYLVRFLRERGYKHVIFYGAAGTKGEYVVDYASARFFYDDDNGSLALPTFDIPDEDNKEDSGKTAHKTSSESEAAARQTSDESGESASDEDGTEKRAYGGSRSTVAAMMGKNRAKKQFPIFNNGSDTAAENSAQSDGTQNKNKSEKPSRVRYSLRNIQFPEFIKRAKVWMENKDPENRIAVVFYNIFTTEFFRETSLIDLITGEWENHNPAGNLCLFLAPTENGVESIVNSVRQARLDGLFLESGSTYGTGELSRLRATYLGNPGADEIKNLLRRLMIIGTSSCRNKAKFNYADIDKLAVKIMADSRKADGKVTLRAIREKYLEKFIDENPDTPLTEEIIDKIWGVETIDRSGALEKMNRRGWEKVYRFFTEFVERETRRDEKRIRDAADMPAPAETVPLGEWAVDRLSLENDSDSDRKIIPNFVIVGPPGVGKTTLSQYIGDLLYEMGYIKTNNTVKVGKQDLVSSYIGGIPQATRECIERANESVLVIDEAHTLGIADGGVNHEPTGKEVVSTLNYYMNDSSRCSVVLLGYEEPMNKLFDIDSGFKGRFAGNIIRMEGYDPALLYDILTGMIRGKGYRLSEALTRAFTEDGFEYNPLMCMIETIYDRRDREKFRNAGVMEKLAEYACGKSIDDTVDIGCFFGYDCNDDGKHRIDGEFFVPKKVFDSFEKIMNDIDAEFVGIQKVKQYLDDIKLEIDEAKKIGTDLSETGVLRALALVGNPGTGKDKIADLLARAYFTLGILGTPEKIERKASDFASPYQGTAQERMNEAIREAQNKKALLFINEAHELCNEHFDGEGALKTLIAPMTDKEKPIMVVFAVYPENYEAFKELDRGLKRRIDKIELMDYTGRELYEILKLNLRKSRLESTEETDEILKAVLDNVYDMRTSATGNAGYVIDELLPAVNKNRRQRCYKNGIEAGTPESRVIIPEDIPASLRENVDVRNPAQRVQDLEALKNEIKSAAAGYEEIKGLLCKKIDALIQNILYPKTKAPVEPGHYFFKGPAGVGKTTGAELFAKYLHKMNLIMSPVLVKSSATDFVAGYTGQTGIKTAAKLNSVRGKVLLIDEAYALGNKGANSGIDSFKQDAIAEIVKTLDDEGFRRSTSVIFCGYSDEMEALYSENSGLRGRIKELKFDAFDLETCMRVLDSIAEKAYFPFSEQARQKLLPVVSELRIAPGFSNGRTLRNFFDFLRTRAGERRLREKYDKDDERAYIIMPEDIPDSFGEAQGYINLAK